MTWLSGIVIALAIFALGVFAGRWSTSRVQIAKRQLTAETRRAGDVEGTEFSAFWDGR